MKRLLALLALCLVASAAPALAQRTIYVSPDVPTRPDGPPIYLPWEVVEHVDGSPAPYALELSLPGTPAIDALHKMDRPDSWLVSLEAPNDLAGLLPAVAEPRDVIRWNSAAGAAALFFDGDCVVGAVPGNSSVDAVYLDGDDFGDLVVSFDVPTTIGGFGSFQPTELVKYVRFAPGPCGWSFAGSLIDFATIGSLFPAATNVIGADFAGGKWIVAFDIPADVAPPLSATRLPGQIVGTDGLSWDPLNVEDLNASGSPGWPINSLVDALSCQANPGRIDPAVAQITMNKSGADVTVICPGSCSSGGQQYGLYEGRLASVRAGTYDHVKLFCNVACPAATTFTPPAGVNTYYLVVPNNLKDEGSYGRDSVGAERPQATPAGNACLPSQVITACP